MKDSQEDDFQGFLYDKVPHALRDVHVRRDDGDVASFQIDFIFDAARNDLRYLVFQFSVGHLHDVHFTLPQSAWTTAYSRRSGKRQGRGKMNLTSGVWQSRHMPRLTEVPSQLVRIYRVQPSSGCKSGILPSSVALLFFLSFALPACTRTHGTVPRI